MAEFHVVEKFVSINGEGTKAGQLAVFVRFKGCNLNCVYCDTKWANGETAGYNIMNEFEIYKYIKDTGVKNVTLTGGEPLYRDDIKTFLKTHVNINITIYYTKHYNGKNFFYIIEGDRWFVTSDEIEDMDILTYNGALNKAIYYVFTKILDIQ